MVFSFGMAYNIFKHISYAEAIVYIKWKLINPSKSRFDESIITAARIQMSLQWCHLEGKIFFSFTIFYIWCCAYIYIYV